MMPDTRKEGRVSGLTPRSIGVGCLAVLICASLVHSRVSAAPGDSVTPGELVVEHPTLTNLGFEWHIDGDANRNASVDVSFRKTG